MIEVRDLSKRYGDKLAVDDLTFNVRPGMVTGFLGPNGAGKSTTMRLILGLDRPTTGSVDGQRQGLPRPSRAAARGRRDPRGARDPHRPVRLQPPARARPDARHPAQPRRRGDRARRAPGGRPQARRHVLARHGPAARHRRGAARRPEDADPGRAVERPRPRGHPLDPQPAALARRRGPDDLRLLAPHERDEHDGRLADRRRPRPADRRHDGRGLRAARVRRRGARAHARRRSGSRLLAEALDGVTRQGRPDGDASAVTLQGISCRGGRRARRRATASCCTSSPPSRHRWRRRSCA